MQNSKSPAGTADEKSTNVEAALGQAQLAQNSMLAAVFQSVEEAVKILKLDRRRKWFEWNGTLVYNMWYTAPKSCTGCDGCGCQECGYTGNRKSCVPVPAFMPDGSIVKVVPQNGS